MTDTVNDLIALLIAAKELAEKISSNGSVWDRSVLDPVVCDLDLAIETITGALPPSDDA